MLCLLKASKLYSRLKFSILYKIQCSFLILMNVSFATVFVKMSDKILLAIHMVNGKFFFLQHNSGK
eukprot:snap_masked-scaffold_103-processed-gene-0.7-mRNA-1 protein AED:1.00 eAED:1.00 QI:0/0/0/0/1/1/3/0/65